MPNWELNTIEKNIIYYREHGADKDLTYEKYFKKQIPWPEFDRIWRIPERKKNLEKLMCCEVEKAPTKTEESLMGYSNLLHEIVKHQTREEENKRIIEMLALHGIKIADKIDAVNIVDLREQFANKGFKLRRRQHLELTYTELELLDKDDNVLESRTIGWGLYL